MKKIFLILICFSSITTYSQFNFSSSRTETLYKTINNNQISFTIIHKNNNGVESKRCILNNSIEVDCKIVDDCFNKNECKEIEDILKTEKKENKEQLKQVSPVKVWDSTPVLIPVLHSIQHQKIMA